VGCKIHFLPACDKGFFTVLAHTHITVFIREHEGKALVENMEELDEPGKSGGESKSLWKQMAQGRYYVYQAYTPQNAIKALQHVCDFYFQFLREKGLGDFRTEEVIIEFIDSC